MAREPHLPRPIASVVIVMGVILLVVTDTGKWRILVMGREPLLPQIAGRPFRIGARITLQISFFVEFFNKLGRPPYGLPMKCVWVVEKVASENCISF